LTIDWESLQSPLFKGGIATFRSITGAMVEGFPHRAAHQDIAHQAGRTVGKALTHIKDETSGAMRGKVGAIGWWLGDSIKGNNWFCTVTTGSVTEILSSLPLSIIAIGGEAIAERTKRSSFVVVTTQYPIMGVFVRLVATQVNDAAGV
jgi:hypothetical protein